MNHPCEDCRQSCDIPCWKVDHGLLVEPQRWINVDDRLPERKGVFLVAYHPCHWDNISPETEVGIDTFRGGKSMSNKAWARNKYQRVTHWMPLPEPPKDEGKKE